MHILKHRGRFTQYLTVRFFFCSILIYTCPFCFRKKKTKRQFADQKQQKMYQNAIGRFYQELDIINIVKTLRMVKTYLAAHLTQR